LFKKKINKYICKTLQKITTIIVGLGAVYELFQNKIHNFTSSFTKLIIISFLSKIFNYKDWSI